VSGLLGTAKRWKKRVKELPALQNKTSSGNWDIGEEAEHNQKPGRVKRRGAKIRMRKELAAVAESTMIREEPKFGQVSHMSPGVGRVRGKKKRNTNDKVK